MFPDPPYPACSWTLTQHMGVVTPRFLYELLGAAVTYRDSADPPARINEHMTTQQLLPPNVRSDTGQPDIWRDYQQVLSELGLMFSTEVVPKITPTSLGLLYLDRHLSFAEVMTLQALRYQYPNGHKNQLSAKQRAALRGTQFENVNGLSRLQAVAGMQLRPAVLIWRILRLLQQENEDARLFVHEIHTYLMRCSTHDDTERCFQALRAARHGGLRLQPGDERQARNASDWIRFLLNTPLFTGERYGKSAYVALSQYAIDHADELDELCSRLENKDSFWMPSPGLPEQRITREDRMSWYEVYGTVDLSLGAVPETGRSDEEEEYPDERQDEEEPERSLSIQPMTLGLREFDPSGFVGTNRQLPEGTTIDTSYDAALATHSKRLHDQMVLLIHNVARARGAEVLTGLADLVVVYHGNEFVIEVKSVTPRNFVQRLRYALGQVLHYDYLRSLESNAPRRRVVGLAAAVPKSMWCVPFVTEFLDIDLLSLGGRALKIYSTSPLAHELFGP